MHIRMSRKMYAAPRLLNLFRIQLLSNGGRPLLRPVLFHLEREKIMNSIKLTNVSFI